MSLTKEDENRLWHTLEILESRQARREAAQALEWAETDAEALVECMRDAYGAKRAWVAYVGSRGQVVSNRTAAGM